ncbi:AAA family ATPase [Paenibacillus sp. sgz302251]|uniref:AAA family ATPase n=1 Tax=Paenibacillus sp. sgz302251 TaxID=3414493 RepID=UPI003C7AAD95
MRLLRAEVDGFGQLVGRQLDLDAPVIVVYGPNEAGKSTMFSFIRTMLYGFAKRTQFIERQEPVNGGKHGGRMFFADSTGQSYVLERYAADRAGKLKLRRIGSDEEAYGRGTERGRGLGQENGALADEAVLLQPEWERRFLGGISDRLYRQLFAVTLTELQEIGALSGDELGRYLYQAGWDSGKSVAAAEKRLMQEMDVLFKPRGSNQQMNQQLKTLEQLDAALRKRTDAIAAYNELMRQLEELEHSLHHLEQELPIKKAQQQLLHKACTVRSLWLRKEQLDRERQAVAYASALPIEAVKSWEELVRLRSECREDAEKSRQKLLLLELQLEAVSYEERFIQISDETEALLQSAETIRQLKHDSMEQDNELREQDDAIARLVSSIAPEWTERQLREFHVTVADRDYVRSARQQELEHSRTEERLAAELEAIKQQEREAAEALADAESAIEREAIRREHGDAGFEILPGARTALKGAWNALDTALREWEIERARVAGAAGAASGSEAAGRGAAAAGRGGAGPLWAAAAGAAGAALALGAAALSGAAAGEAAGGAGLAALALAIAALALAVAAIWRSRGGDGMQTDARRGAGGLVAGERDTKVSGGSRLRGRSRGSAASGSVQQDAELEEREQRVHQALEAIVREPSEAAASLLAAKHHSSPEHLLAAGQARTQLLAAVEARLEALQHGERLSDNRSELARRHERLRALAHERSEAVAAAAQTRQASARQWAGWLAARALPEAMSPSAALEAFELAEQALQRLRQYDRLTAKQAAARKQVAAFTSQAAALCEGFEEAERLLAADPVLALRLLHAEIRRHAAALQEARGMEARRAELQLALDASETRLQELHASMAAQMDAAGIQNELQYETALTHRQLAFELDMELNRLELEITAGLSLGRIAELAELFKTNDEEQLAELQAAAQAELLQLEERRQEQLERRGSLRQGMEHLLKEEEQQELLSQKEMTIAQLSADAERYAVLSISAALIRSTKRIYEEERQPVVLRNASRYIAKLTGGKYIRVLATPGEPSIRLEASDHRLIDSSLLSRGTAEQVYLAMRLALAEEASQSVRLPLLLDDVFVNFDRQRLHAVTSMVAELAGDRQIIVMTCHEHIRDAMLEHCKDALLVQM